MHSLNELELVLVFLVMGRVEEVGNAVIKVEKTKSKYFSRNLIGFGHSIILGIYLFSYFDFFE